MKIVQRFGLCTVALLLLSGAGCDASSSGDGAGGTGGTSRSIASGSSGGASSGGNVASSSTTPSGGSSATSSSSVAGSSTTSSATRVGGSSVTASSASVGGSSTIGGTSATGGKGGSGGTSKAGNTGGGAGGTGGARTSTGTTGTTGGTTAGGASGTAGVTGAGDGGVAQACASPLPAITDYSALAGPFATTTENNTGPAKKSVIYRPKTLGENGFLHAPIVFGPGIGMKATQLSGLLTSFASHGYVVVGTDVLNGGPKDPGNLKTMRDTLNWIIQQNDTAGTYQGKLATKCAISMGYSVGGTSAVEMGGDAPIATTVSIHGHTASSAMHGPLLQTSGDQDGAGLPLQQATFQDSKVQTFFGTVSGANHGYIQSNNGGVERVAIIAWMRYWINGDTGAKKYFWGDSCICCVSPWMNPQRKNWE